MTVRIVIVDDNNLFRKGIAALLAAHPDFNVIADFRTGKEAVQASIELQPDIVLMDVVLAGVNGLDVVGQIKRRQAQTYVVLLTVVQTDDYVRAALRVGADGYVLKDASVEELHMALRSVAMGKKYLSPDVSGHVVDSFLNPQARGAQDSRLGELTGRERSVLQLIAEGRTNRSAAEFLNLSPKTVEKHRSTLMHKLGLRNAAELMLAAIELRLIGRPPALSRLTRIADAVVDLEDAGDLR